MTGPGQQTEHDECSAPADDDRVGHGPARDAIRFLRDKLTAVDLAGVPSIHTLTRTDGPPLRFKGVLLAVASTEGRCGSLHFTSRLYRRTDRRVTVHLSCCLRTEEKPIVYLHTTDGLDTMYAYLEEYDAACHVPVPAALKSGELSDAARAIMTSQLRLRSAEARLHFADCTSQLFDKLGL